MGQIVATQERAGQSAPNYWRALAAADAALQQTGVALSCLVSAPEYGPPGTRAAAPAYQGESDGEQRGAYGQGV